MPQPAKKDPCSAVEECKQTVELILDDLYETAQRTFTVDVLKPFEDDLSSVIRTLRKIPAKCMASRDMVNRLIFKARGELGLAIKQLDERGVTREFNKCLDNCLQHLDDAIQVWDG